MFVNWLRVLSTGTQVLLTCTKFTQVLLKSTFQEGVRAPAVHPRFRCFAGVFLEKRLDLKSLKGQTKAEELRDRVPELLSLRLLLKAL